MKEFLSNKYLLTVIRIVIGAVFIYASFNKLFNPADFAKAILRYDMAPLFIINIMAIILPWVEFSVGVMLIFGIMKKPVSILAAFSLIFFLFALISAYARGLDISCGCFSLEETSSKGDILQRIIEDFFMLAGTYIIYKFSGPKKELETVNSVNNNINEIK
ncbi:MAG: DoxX family membrane protein [Ignavibacteria bacterium]|jgi:uncharacterized membrane protein YphA (DoxX/SURF4 family)|nr:DoxX family membrane protein [Ignavibacteria bacterium]